MLGVDNATSEVVHHFLRSLTVKVSRTTVCRLLDSPLGNTMQGISDALNALHVNNVVYQLNRSIWRSYTVRLSPNWKQAIPHSALSKR